MLVFLAMIASLLVFAVLVMPPQTPRRAQPGTLSGQIRSAEGGLVAGVRVAAMLASDGSGKIVATTQTGNDGRYQIEKIPAGQYYILAGPPEAPFYYPGVLAGSAAKPVTVASGATVRGIDFPIRRVGVTVSGRILSDSFDSQFALIRITGSRGDVRETTAAGGAFEFHDVLPGNYKLEGPAALNLDPAPIVVSFNDVVNVRLASRSGPVYRVTGRVVVSPGRPTDLRMLTVSLFPKDSLKLPRRSEVRNDGSFEFTDVSPGEYSVGSASNTALSTTNIDIEIHDKDVQNVEVRLAVQIPTRIHLTMEGGAPFPSTGPIRMRARIGGTYVSGSVGPLNEQTFLLDGMNYVFLSPPAGYFVKSLKSGDVDLLKDGLNVESSVSKVGIEGVIGVGRPSSESGVSVRGHVNGGHPGMKVRLVDPIVPGGGKYIDATTNSRGEFEFRNVGPGAYNLDVLPALSVRPDLIVVGQNVTGIEATVPEGIVVTARMMTVVDPGGRPVVSQLKGVSLRLTGTKTSKVLPLGYAASIEGVFEDTYRVSLEGLPPGFSVRAILSGRTDLLREALRINKDTTPGEIQVSIEGN